MIRGKPFFLATLEEALGDTAMEWADLKQLDRQIRKMEDLGARVEEIGVSGEGRSLYGVTVGGPQATRTVVIVAGCHADEVIGPLTAIFMLQTLLHHEPPSVRVCVVPVADPDFVFRNAIELPATVPLQALLNLEHQRDLEGHFTADTYPECVAIRRWIEQLERVDAYFSLHSAHCISPGLFFYVGKQSNVTWVHQVAEQVAVVTPSWIPLLSNDPTGLSQKQISPGFFELELPADIDLTDSHPGSSLAFVAHRFHPQYFGASEIPLAVCADLAQAPLAEIYRCNQDVRRTGHTSYSFQEIDLDTQLRIMEAWIGAVIRQVSATATADNEGS
ncbi:MAG: M14 family zinc carboxypeptidase [Cyanobacteria bacterium J06638_22]